VISGSGRRRGLEISTTSWVVERKRRDEREGSTGQKIAKTHTGLRSLVLTYLPLIETEMWVHGKPDGAGETTSTNVVITTNHGSMIEAEAEGVGIAHERHASRQ